MSEASDQLYAAEGEAMREAMPHCKAAEQFRKTMLFIGTPNGCNAIKADPKAAERAKRYIWSRIERNQASSGRAE